MAKRNTLPLLPGTFQTDANKKFLNATVDQLTTEANVIPVNGYIGRKMSPGFKNTANYVQEPTVERNDYQLEPTITSKNSKGEYDLAITYPELLERIRYYGGTTTDPNSLFSQDFNSFYPKINLDAFVNFSEYFWIPNGPSAVDVYAAQVQTSRTFTPIYDSDKEVFTFGDRPSEWNPTLTVARGGTYTFYTDYTDGAFWIETSQGQRAVLGVTNNGNSTGTVVFNVPTDDAQKFYHDLAESNVAVDIATTLSYASINGANIADISFSGIDGQTSYTQLNGKKIIFIGENYQDSDWTTANVAVAEADRNEIFEIAITANVISLSVSTTQVDAEKPKFTVAMGTYANTQWYKAYSNGIEGRYIQIPLLTARLDELFYRSGAHTNAIGRIQLVDNDNLYIDVTRDIIGKTSYTSKNSIVFTNGLKVRFDASALPAEYQNKEYYVEGVGTGISLTPVNELVINFAQSKSSFNPETVFEQNIAVLNSSRDGITVSTTVDPTAMNVAVGIFDGASTRINPNSITLQDYKFEYPYRGGLNEQGEHNALKYAHSVIGVTTTGIPLYTPVSETTIESNGKTWTLVSPKVIIEGQDAYGGYPTEDGVYHYYDATFIATNAWANVEIYNGNLRYADGHSKIVGFAADGYPIYGPWGYSDPLNRISGTVRMISGYTAQDNSDRPSNQTTHVAATAYVGSQRVTLDSTVGIEPGMRITVNTGGLTSEEYWVIDAGSKTVKNSEISKDLADNQVYLNKPLSSVLVKGASLTFEYLLGSFVEDYTFTGSIRGDYLDRYNGRYCVTPDFPYGTYAYFMTAALDGNGDEYTTYPYIVGQSFYGSTTASTNKSLSTPDYIMINRSSEDRNAWSRRNRWFHREVIEYADKVNGTTSLILENRAKRPIIEFQPHIQLFDFGSIAIQPVDIVDTTNQNPFAITGSGNDQPVQGKSDVLIDGVRLITGMRVIFSNAVDLLVRNKVYTVEIISTDTESNIVNLVEAETVVDMNTVSAFNGDVNVNKSFWFDGNIWHEGQHKTAVNQAPRFDVVDENGISYGDRSVYSISNEETAFKGTKLFGYSVGTGANDSVLGFPLKYRSFNNVGDIEFTNYYDTETFVYSVNGTNITGQANNGAVRVNTDIDPTKFVPWAKTNHVSRQAQIIPYIYDGEDYNFLVDVMPRTASLYPTLEVYVNAKKIDKTKYQFVTSTDTTTGKIYHEVIIRGGLTAGDRVDIAVDSDEISTLGYFEVPLNLNNNPMNETITKMTLGELRNHATAMVQHSLKFSGKFPGTGNLRDIDVSDSEGTIIQHSAPVTPVGMFLGNEQYNVIDAIKYAAREYTRFKNRFLTAATNSSFINSPTAGVPQIVDQILKQLNAVKNNTFPWHYSDMLAYGTQRRQSEFRITSQTQRNFPLYSAYSSTTPSSQAVYVYRVRSNMPYQLLLGESNDYTISTTTAGIVLNADFDIAAGDTIFVFEYASTDGSYIPETPTKMGLYPKFKPQIFDQTDPAQNLYYRMDNNGNAVQTQRFIQGHDGSLTPAFGDIRDELLLELESRIYNNIKVVYNPNSFNVHETRPGAFRTDYNPYTLQQFNQTISKVFLSWAGINGLNYKENNLYLVKTQSRSDSTDYSQPNPLVDQTVINGDAFAYNYYRSKDRNGNYLPGSWRATYEYYYDTQRPHICPWEMLGFSEKPVWWEDTYGPAPYTAGNAILWEDLEAGRIKYPTGTIVNRRFARPGLTAMVPVDEYGNLLPPLGVVTGNYDSSNFGDFWLAGHQGPVETAWRNSSEYPFAVQIVGAITQPAKYFVLGISTDLYNKDVVLDRYVLQGSARVINKSTPRINGMTASTGATIRAAGYLNWINDAQVGKGINDGGAGLLAYIYGTNVQLGYRVGGFTSKDKLKFIAEQYSPNSVNDGVIIPDNDYSLLLQKSNPAQTIVYSSVIIERQTTGFSVRGYNIDTPYFDVVIPSETGNYDVVTSLSKEVKYYNDFRRILGKVTYGTVFKTEQEVSDFLCGYARYLAASGFVFDRFDADLSRQRDWKLAVEEFLFWTQQGWKSGDVIVVGPGANELKIYTPNFSVDDVTSTSSSILDVNFAALTEDKIRVVRDGNLSTITANENTAIGLAKVNLVRYEHVVVFNNTSQFNDVIFHPLTGQRQHRIKMVGQRTGDWNGYLQAPGFVYNDGIVQSWKQNTDYMRGDMVEYKGFYYAAKDKTIGTDAFDFSDWEPVDSSTFKTGLLKNFATQAGALKNAYEIENINYEDQYSQYALGLIGYRSRTYLDNLGINDTTQVKFYQGFIKAKGTRGAVNALGNIAFNDRESSVEINEEWAFRVGAYGALDTNQSVDIVLPDNFFVNNPTTVEVLSNSAIVYSNVYQRTDGIVDATHLPFNSNFLLSRSISSDYSEDVKSAGFVHLDDAQYTAFDVDSISVDIDTVVQAGETIWVANDANNTWNIYAIERSTLKATALSNALDGNFALRFSTDHNFNTNDLLLMKNFQEFDGFYSILAVADSKTIVLTAKRSELLDGYTTQSTEDGVIYVLRSRRHSYASDLVDSMPQSGWKLNSNAWVSNDTTGWATYNKSEPWGGANVQLPYISQSVDGNMGEVVSISPSGRYYVTGQPGADRVSYFAVDSISNAIVHSVDIHSYADNSQDYGKAVLDMDTYVVVGSSTTSGAGYVEVYQRDAYSIPYRTQAFTTQATGANLDMGRSLAVNYNPTDDENNNTWMFVGAPESDQVHVYHLDRDVTSTVSNTFTYTSGTTTYALNRGSESRSELVRVTNASQNKTLVAYRDYVVNGTGDSITIYSGAINDDIILVQQDPGYAYFTTITAPNSSSNFGYSVATSTDGRQVVIGAPTAVGDGYTSGRVYIYDRSVEKFIKSNTDSTFQITIENTYSGTLSDTSHIYDNGVLLTSGTDYTVSGNAVTITRAVTVGNVVSVETNGFNLINSHAAFIRQNTSRFGHSVDLCHYNCTVFVGAPDYSVVNTKYERWLTDTTSTAYRTGAIIERIDDTGTGTFYKVTSNIASGTAWTTAAASNLVEFDEALLTRNETERQRAGAVWRYLNQGRVYGTITGTVANPTVAVGDSIRINDFTVTFTGTTLEQVVIDINTAQIPGITASVVDSKLRIDSDSTLYADLLRVLPNDSTTLAALGLEVFTEVEKISNPSTYENEQFGHCVKVNDTTTVLAISGPHGVTIQATSFDYYNYNFNGTRYLRARNPLTDSLRSVKATTFDGDGTRFVDETVSGAVWMYSVLDDSRSTVATPSKFAYIQQVYNDDLGSSYVNEMVRFGQSIDLNGNNLFVGAPDDSERQASGGAVFKFTNTTGLRGWDTIRREAPRVDINSIVKAFTHRSDQGIISDFLDHIDPAKGKILGIAEQELTYKTDYDPASYNNGDDSVLTVSETYVWDNRQVGQLWWDLSKVRYINYEQGTVEYRAAHWGEHFPGSTIEVYEWVESEYPPAQWALDGTVKDASAYTVLNYVDPLTNVATVRYYFWVKDRTEVPSKNGRKIPSATIVEYINNPKASGVKYFAPLAVNAIALYNISNTDGDNLLVHLDYATKLNENIIHSEFALLGETGSSASDVPAQLYTKMIDSMAGIDSVNNPVPDYRLPSNSKYGIETRPRQTVFLDRQAAIKEAITYINSEFKKLILADGYNLTTLSSGETAPTQGDYGYTETVASQTELQFLNISTYSDGTSVLVESDSVVDGLWSIYEKRTSSTSEPYWQLMRVQGYRVSDYWSYIDWYADGFNAYSVPRYIVNTVADMKRYKYIAGDVVKVKDRGDGRWVLYQVSSFGTFTVGVERGTIALSSNLYDIEAYGLGFGADNFDTVRMDQNASLELRKVFEAVKSDLFVGQLDTKFVELFFTLVYYILDEQKNVDWIFKTSFINVLHKLDGLQQLPIYRKNNSDSYREYVEEVKPYHTTIRQHIVDYTGTDNWQGYASDYDLVPYKDANGLSRKPVFTTNANVTSGANPGIQSTNSADIDALAKIENIDWKRNFAYHVESITVVDDERNANYYADSLPRITITGSTTGDNATARAVVANGKIVRVEVIQPGSGYVENPIVTVEGTAQLDVRLSNPVTRKVKTVLTYDRTTYGRVPQKWRANVGKFDETTETWNNLLVTHYGYKAGDIVINEGITYLVNRDHNVSSTQTFSDVVEFYDVYSDNTLALTWETNTTYYKGQIVAHGGNAYRVRETFTSSTVFTGNQLDILPVGFFTNANDRIEAYYEPGTGLLGKQFALLQTGIDYPGTVIEGPLFSDAGGFDAGPSFDDRDLNDPVRFTEYGFDTAPFDSITLDEYGNPTISEGLLDTQINGGSYLSSSVSYLDPASIVVDGGDYVYENLFSNVMTFSVNANVSYTSGLAQHAPEELVPGRVYDTLDIKVRTANVDPTSTLYTNWAENTRLRVASVLITDPGSDYVADNVTVEFSADDSIVQARARVTLSSDGLGRIAEISVVGAGANQGLGYSAAPTVRILGSNSSPASAVAIMTTVENELQQAGVIASNSTLETFAYRMFKDMNDEYSYATMANTTTLVQTLNLNDATIVVANAANITMPITVNVAPIVRDLRVSLTANANYTLTIPGVIFIGTERIEFSNSSATTGQVTLSNIRRATSGTSAIASYAANTVVTDGGTNSNFGDTARHYLWHPNATVGSTTQTTTASRAVTFYNNYAYMRTNFKLYNIGANTYYQPLGTSTSTENQQSALLTDTTPLENILATTTAINGLTDGRGLFNSNTAIGRMVLGQ